MYIIISQETTNMLLACFETVWQFSLRNPMKFDEVPLAGHTTVT